MQHHQKKLWFKAKNYGWGWYPITWQGWLVLVGYIGILQYRVVTVHQMFDTVSSFSWRLFFEVIFITIPLIVICYAKGEKPEWRWGGKKI